MKKLLRHRAVSGTASMAALIGAGAVLGVAGKFPAVAQDQTGKTTAKTARRDWPELRGDTTRRGVSDEKIAPPLSLLWRFSAGAQANNPCAPAVVGDTVYYAARARSDRGGTVFAVDANTGAKKWQFPNDDNGLLDKAIFLTAPLVTEGKVFIGASNGYMYVLNAQNGSQIVRFKTARAINSSPSLVDNVLYFGSNDGTFYALDPKTGNYVWNQTYQVRDGINSAPIIADGMVFFTTNDNTIHALRQATGIRRWSFRTPGRVPDDGLVYSDNTLYAPAGRHVLAIQPNSGLTRWDRTLPDDVIVPPVADAGTIYAIIRNPRAEGAYLYALRANNGRDLWDKPVELPLAPVAAPTLVGNILFLPTNQNQLLAVSPDTGKLLWEYYTQVTSNLPRPQDFQNGTGGTGGFGGGRGGFGNRGRNRRGVSRTDDVSLTAPVAVANGTIYVIGDDGSLSAFRSDAPDSTGPEMTEMYPPSGFAVSGQPPVTLAAKITDVGSGVNPDSLVVKLDDARVKADFDQSRNLLIYVTRDSGKIIDQPLTDGRHTVTVTASDYRGNKTEESWSFIVNNSLPAQKRQAPVARTTRNTGAPGPSTPGGGRTRAGARRGGGTGPGNGTGAPNPPDNGGGAGDNNSIP